MTRILRIGLLLLLLPGMVAAQSRNADLKNKIIQQRIELIAEQAENENIDFTTLIDRLSYYYDRPLNLNTASRDELQELELLSPFQVNSIVSYRQQYGEFTTLYELRLIPQLDWNSIEALLPFVKATPRIEKDGFSLKRAFRYGRHDLFLRYSRVLEEQEGYASIDPAELAENPNRRYQGSPDRLYTRYRYQFGDNLSIGVTGDKDAGEEFFTGSNPNGFDFYSAHLYLGNVGPVKQLAIGDFQAQFGQGLTFWSGLNFGKSADALNVLRYDRKLTPYTAANENLFLRGGGATIELGSVEVTGFYSRKNIDANIDQTDTLNPNELVFTSLQQSGFHRTLGEIEDKDALEEEIAGGHISIERENLKIGGTGVWSRYRGDFSRDLDFYNQFDINDNENVNLGLDFDWIVKNFHFFGEGSRSRNGGWAYLAGALIQVDPRVELVVFQRNYQRDFQSVYGGAIGESSRNQNERGTYLGARMKLTPRLNFTGYFDRFKFDWLRFVTDAPSDGADYLGQLNYTPSRGVEMYVRYREETKGRNTRRDLAIRYPVEENRRYIRYDISYRLTPSLQGKNRLEWSRYQQEDTSAYHGFLIYQDIKYERPGSKWAFWGRLALFDMESFDARIYAYENDVLYFFNVPAYSDRGVRYYVMTKYAMNRSVTLWVRLAHTYFTNRYDVGSGLEQIDEPQRTEVRVQLRIRI